MDGWAGRLAKDWDRLSAPFARCVRAVAARVALFKALDVAIALDGCEHVKESHVPNF